MEKSNEGYVFGLDIGTRSIVGTIGYRIGTDKFIVVAQESIEHTTRAVIDGQIHDISTVTKTITEIKSRLESKIRCDLTDVSIAAAGRVLKTKKVHAVSEFPKDTKVTDDLVQSLDMLGVEKAYEEIRRDVDDEVKHFYCVGYSAVKYYLNGYPMEMISMHTAKNIGVDLIATFLPDEVVDGLYAAVEAAGLHVSSMTLEPIAAIQVAIPEKFRLLNIALVDVGAGTSDISIVKDGSIIAFGMIPLAGDEITESIAQNYLVDFETAEYVKRQCEKRRSISFRNIFGENIQVDQKEIAAVTLAAVDEITRNVATQIIELNGGKSVSAVFVVGGGGKHEGFTQKLAEYLELPENRVALRGAEVLANVKFEQAGIQKDSTLVTPIGICLNYYEQKNNFIHVVVNDQRVKLYDNGKATVLDACISSGFSQNNLFPIRGEELRYFVNGEERVEKGKSGEVVLVRKNGKEVSLNEPAMENDKITIRPSTKGEDGHIMLGDIPECKEELRVVLFGKTILCPRMVEVNGFVQSSMYDVKPRDEVRVFDYYSLSGIMELADVEGGDRLLLNGSEVGLDAEVRNGDVIEHVPEPETGTGGSGPKEENGSGGEGWQPDMEGGPGDPGFAMEEELGDAESGFHMEGDPGDARSGFPREMDQDSLYEPEGDPEDTGQEREKVTKSAGTRLAMLMKPRERAKEEPLGDARTQMANDPFLQSPKPLPEWMRDIPFDTPKLVADDGGSGSNLPDMGGVRHPDAEEAVPADVDDREHTVDTGGAEAPGQDRGSPAAPTTQVPAHTGPVEVFVNGDVVALPAKEKPIFVDVFDVYPFDLTKAGGIRLVARINGVDKDFTEPLQEGDEIELRWEK